MNIYTVAPQAVSKHFSKNWVPRGWFAGAHLDEKKCETGTHPTVGCVTPRIERIGPILRLLEVALQVVWPEGQVRALHHWWHNRDDCWLLRPGDVTNQQAPFS